MHPMGVIRPEATAMIDSVEITAPRVPTRSWLDREPRRRVQRQVHRDAPHDRVMKLGLPNSECRLVLPGLRVDVDDVVDPVVVPEPDGVDVVLQVDRDWPETSAQSLKVMEQSVLAMKLEDGHRFAHGNVGAPEESRGVRAPRPVNHPLPDAVKHPLPDAVKNGLARVHGHASTCFYPSLQEDRCGRGSWYRVHARSHARYTRALGVRDMAVPVRYRPTPDRDAHLAAIKGLVAHILAMDGPPSLAVYKRSAIDRLLWNITKVDGKYRTRYRSEGALNVDRREDRRLRPAGQRLLQHEHVYTRSWLLTQLMERPGEAGAILDLAIGCVVTKAEHELLSGVRKLVGWARYRAAGVRVYDLAGDQPILLAGSHDPAAPTPPPAPPPPPPARVEEVEAGSEGPGETGGGALPLKAAYSFGAQNGLASEVSQVRTMEIRWDSSYTSSVRRGYIIELFEKRGIFDSFKEAHWPAGNTPKGVTKARRYLRIKADYERTGAKSQLGDD